MISDTVTSVFSSVWPYRLARWSLGLLFIYTGVVKLMDLGAFAENIADFGLVHPRLIQLTAVTIPVLETLAGVGLVLDLGFSLPVITALLTMFTTVLSYGLFLGLDIECGCLGTSRGLSMQAMLSLDLSLLGICVYLFWCRSRRRLQPARTAEIPSKPRSDEAARTHA
jgi:uncharacterized membrane protein YphA (DoxX/SURF4 family)